MRAVRYTKGGNVCDVKIPHWVKFNALDTERMTFACERCESSHEVRISSLRSNFERELGRFADHHRRCPDRAAIRTAVKRAEQARRRYATQPPTIYFRKVRL